MESVKERYIKFKNAHASLEMSLKTAQRVQQVLPGDADVEDTLLASIIKHFEFTYEMCWKFLKEYLYKVNEIEEVSPKAIFRACYAQRILPLDVAEELIDLVDDRNRTAHMYDEEIAMRVFDSIKKHYDVLGKVIELVKIPENI